MLEMALKQLGLTHEKIRDFCEAHHINTLSFFGSVLREDFNEASDIDVLITLEESWDYSLLDLAGIKCDLEDMLGREVDLLTRRGVSSGRNLERKKEILSSAQVVYDKAA